jgi:Tat protein translocase TatB subunit
VFNIGPAELMIIFILALLVVGPKKLPELSRQLGRGLREFRRVSDEVRGEIDGALNMDLDDDQPPVDKPSAVSSNGSAADSTVASNGSSAETVEAADPAEDAPGDGAPSPERTD